MNPSRQASFSLARVLRLVTGLLVVGSLVACSSLTPPAQTSGPVPFLRLDMDGQVAAAQATADGATLSTGLDAEPALPPYRFGVGDEFDLRVPDAPQFDLALKVRPDGKVSLPMIGTLHVKGRSPEDVQDEVRERLNALSGGPGNREYLLHTNDELEIKFPYMPTLNESVRVRPDGKLQLQMVGVVQAEGLSPEELQAQLKQRYAKFLRSPEVSVLVRSFGTQNVRVGGEGTGRAGLANLRPNIIARSTQATQVFVGGEVARPGVLAYRPGLSLLQALIEAGGQLPSGDVTQMVILRRGANDKVEVFPLRLSATYFRAPNKDIQLQPFDVVLLPKSGISTLGDQLNQYVFNLFPLIRNSALGLSYNLRSNTP